MLILFWVEMPPVKFAFSTSCKQEINFEYLQKSCLSNLNGWIILTAQFEDAKPPESEIIHMWIDGLNNAVTYVMFNGHRHPRLELDCDTIPTRNG